MKKTLLLIALAGAMPAAAHHLTPEQALERALPAASRSAAADFELVETRGSLYLFEGAESGSTLVVTSDSRLRPVLARIDGASAASEAPALEWWLSQYNAEIAAALTSVTPGQAANYAGWTPVEPILNCKWGQSSPYNDRCPSGTSTGCVATAMAQVIYTNRYAHGAGTCAYDWNGTTLSFDFGKAEFDFDAMTDTYGSSSNAESKRAVAELMYACGVSVRMAYGPESSAGPAAIAPALRDYFGYDDLYTYDYWRPMFQTADWERIIYNEVAAGRGVIYGGTTSAGAGHAFVVDGYSDNGLFHINWGWGGASDGYFALSALNPYDKTITGADGGFNNGQYAVFAVAPGASSPQVVDVPDPSEKADLSGCKIIDFSAGNGFYIGSQTRVSFAIVNTGTVDFNDFVHVGIYNSDNEEICYGERMNMVVAPGDVARVSLSIQVEGEKELQMYPGKHTLRIQDHWRQTMQEYTIDVVEGEPTGGWQPAGLSFFVANAADFDGGAVISGRNWTHVPQLNCYQQQQVDLGLTFYEPGTDNVVTTLSGVKATFGLTFDRQYNWPQGAPRISLAWGLYDMCYTNSGVPCSARIRVRVGATNRGINYAPSATDVTKVGVAPGSYRRAVAIPATVEIAGAERTVTALEDGAFGYTDVTSVDLPAGISSIGMHSLRYTHSLRHLVIRAEEPPFEHEAMFTYGMYYNAAVYVPAGSIDAYSLLMPSRPLYAIINALEAPEATVQVETGKETTVEIGVQPATAMFNPECEVKVEPEGAVEVVGVAATAEGALAMTLKGVTEGEATLTVTPAQPGVDPVALTVNVTEQNSITDVNAAASESAPVIYDLMGRRLAAPVRGINIINGRKQIVN